MISNDHDKMKAEEKVRWYAARTSTGQEKRAVLALENRLKHAPEDIKRCIHKIIVPTEQVVEMHRGQKRTSERKYFPGYVLIQMVMNEDLWHFIRNTESILGFIGARKAQLPTPLSDKEVDEILARVEAGADKPKPKITFVAGQVVRIISGPFADFNGVVEEVNYEKNRLRVSVLIFGRSTPVELEFGQVEKG